MPGPANLGALGDSPCVFGSLSKLHVGIDPDTGAVAMRCLSPGPSVHIDMPIRMSRLQVSYSGGVVDRYDPDISYGSWTQPVAAGDGVLVEFWVMEPMTYSCNGSAPQTPETQGMYGFGTCTLTDVTDIQTVKLYVAP